MQSKISFLHTNIRSLKKNFEEFQHHVLSELNFSFSVIGVSETRICDSECSSNFVPELPGYYFESVPTPLSAGGVGLFIDQNCKYRVLERVSNSCYQALWIELHLPNNKKSVCGVTYRQHNNANEFLDYLSDFLERQSRQNLNIYIMGDFNIDLLTDELCENAVNLPPELDAFLSTLLTGNTEITTEYPHRVRRLVNSFGQDIIYGVTGGRQKPPKHILLPYAVKTLTNMYNVELIQMLNRRGHGIAYSQIEEINTALCLQKMALTPDNEVPLPENIQAYVNTTLAWDNVDRLEETLSGAGPSHRVNGIAVQARQFGPNLPPAPGIEQARTRKRSIDPSVISAVPPYNAGDRCGPRARTFVEVTAEEILAEARKKNLLWILVRLHAEEKQKASGWTGFNISVRNKVQV